MPPVERSKITTMKSLINRGPMRHRYGHFLAGRNWIKSGMAGPKPAPTITIKQKPTQPISLSIPNVEQTALPFVRTKLSRSL